VIRRVPVDGGELAVEVTPGDTEPVLAVHGLSSNRRLWSWLQAEDPGLTLVAPDLRGRADSVDVPGPSSVAQHAQDLVAVLDAVGLDRAVVVGMSMGGFVAVALASAHPDRVAALVLVDGGFPMAQHPTDPDRVRAAFAPAADRARHTYADVQDYIDAVAPGMPLLDRLDPILHGTQAHDLDAEGRPRLDPTAVLDDAVDTVLGPERWRGVTVPTTLLHAEWSIGAGSSPAYPAEAVAGFRSALPALHTTELIDGADHAATVMTRRGAAVVARHVRAALAAQTQ
jgi:pimeloyl-ACP methyl ester carboxylesterase